MIDLDNSFSPIHGHKFIEANANIRTGSSGVDANKQRDMAFQVG